MKVPILLLVISTTIIFSAPNNRTARCWVCPFDVAENIFNANIKVLTKVVNSGPFDVAKKIVKFNTKVLTKVADSDLNPVKPLLNVLLNPKKVLEFIKVPDWLPSSPWRRGPYSGVCTCLGNIGGCYIDKPPEDSFTCKCVKAEGFVTGRNYGCLSLGYKLGWDEEHTGGTADLQQCRNGQKSPFSEFRLEGDCGGYIDNFSDNTWRKVQEKVTMKLFTPYTHISPGSEECDIWSKGQNIDCSLYGEESYVTLPSGFNRNFPVKGIIHGFGDDARFRSEAVAEYNKKFRGRVNVILFDWSKLSKAIDLEHDTLGNFGYFRGARNVPIVGEYLGRCLAGISKETGLRGRDIHIIGHSLGGQMLGRLGRAYHRWVKHLTGGGEKLGRLTALDPAGPAFRDGADDVDADRNLFKERIQKDAATFVDVIHTNAAEEGPVLVNIANPLMMRLGDYGPNGHLDFYPDGGDTQHGCNPWNPANEMCLVGCSHERSYRYFIDSINDDCKFSKYVDGIHFCMGENAMDNWQKGMAYDITVNTQDWYKEHRTPGIITDCKVTGKFACKVFANIYTGIMDSGICANDFSPNCYHK